LRPIKTEPLPEFINSREFTVYTFSFNEGEAHAYIWIPFDVELPPPQKDKFE